MPTAAKLVSLLYFALLAFFLGQMVQQFTRQGLFQPLLVPDTVFGIFSYVCALIGGLSGWFVVGQVAGRPRGGRGLSRTVSFGLRSSATMLFFAVFLFGAREMLILAMKMRYHGPVEALQEMLGLMIEYAKLFLMPTLGVTLVVGGLFGGVVAEIAAKLWR